MKLLPAHTTGVAMVRFEGPKVPTHMARYQAERRYPGGYEYDVLGSLLVDVASDADARRLKQLDRKLSYLFDGVRVERVMIKLDAPPPKRFSDLQRFRRKMGMVLRAYEQEQEEIRALKHGLFVEDELARLDRDLTEAWAKAEQIYGCTKAEFYDTN